VIRRFLSAVRNLLGLRRADRDLDDEIAAYQDLVADEKMAAGLPAERARRAARLEAGGPDHVKEAVRDVRAGAFVEQLARDLRYALRTLRRSPGFTLFTTLTFAIAIGGLSVIFSLVNAVLLKPLPYPDSQRLVMTLEASASNPVGGFSVAAPNFLDWQRRQDVFSGMALYETQGYNLSGDGDPEQVGGIRVTGGVFGVLGVSPLLGRGLLPADDALANGRVVVLGHALWRRRFGGDSSIIGRTIQVNGTPHQVIGVMPPRFAFPATGTQVYVPIDLNTEDQGRASHSFFAIARLKDGVSAERARAEMRTIGDRLAAEYPVSNAGETATAFPMSELWIERAQDTLRTLFVAVALVLLIASANIASLIVARDASRRREFAARMALGGSRWRIVRQLVTESLVVAAGGAALGLALAVFGIRALVGLFPPSLRYVPFRDLSSVSLDPVVVLVALGVAAVAGIVAGLIPALAVLPAEPGDALREGSARGATARGHRLRAVLVGVEVALAVVVVVGAGLLISSIRRLQQVAPGLDVHNVALLPVQLPQPDFYGPAVRQTWCGDVAREVSAVPGVVSVSAVSHLPLSGANAGRSFIIEGAADPGPANLPSSAYGVACPGFFRTMKIQMLAGREFTPADRAGAPPVMIINQRLREKYFPNQDPVGRRFKLGEFDSPNNWVTIIGVAADVHHNGLQSPPVPYFWATYAQAAWPGMSVVVRTATSPLALVPSVREALKRAAPAEPIGDAETMDQVVEASLGHLRFPMVLFAVFAAAALSLAALGCFGVASQGVVQRRRELAIRMALGARASSVYRMVIGQAMTPVVWGIATGIIGALAGTRILSQLLYEIKPTDPRMMIAGAGVLGIATVIACLAPARRAAHVDPATVLREE
jgi:predicted permease